MTDRPAPPPPRRWRGLVDVVQFALFVAVLLWLVVQGAQSMGYSWQWNRVLRHIFQVFEGELLFGPLLNGLVVTLQISALAMVLTVVIGLGAAILRLSDSIVGGAIVRVYVEIVRNTPLLVQLFLFYFVLAPILGIDRFWTGVLALAVFEAPMPPKSSAPAFRPCPAVSGRPPARSGSRTALSTASWCCRRPCASCCRRPRGSW